ncbi:MAG TPA: hypothetical protein PKA88_24130 [Polyangiaceae bacterium]|nr:hypothetical protein [Polyangiaceae bacterium]
MYRSALGGTSLRAMRLFCSSALFVAFFLGQTTLLAQDKRSVRLEYALGAGATTCPERGELSEAVAAELGYVPFSDSAKETLSVRIAEQGGALVASLALKDETGALIGERELSAAAGDCGELARTLALAVAIAIDPLRAGEPKPKPDPEPETATPPSPPPPASVEPKLDRLPPSPPPTFMAIRVAGGGLIAAGVAPALAPGIWVHGGVGLDSFSIGVDGRATFSASDNDARGTVSASLIAATLVPCLHVDSLFLCPTATIGALQGTGENVSRPNKATTVHASAGARIGIEVPRDRYLSFVAHGGIDANLTRTTLKIDGQDVWTTPTLSGGFAGGARFRF